MSDMTAKQCNSAEIEPFIGADEVAKLLGVSLRTARTYFKNGWIPGVKLPNGTVKFLWSEIVNHIESKYGVGYGSVSTVDNQPQV